MFGTLEPDVMFYGRMIEKIGDDRYRITNGAFTSCAQPTPRWEIVSSKATIDLEDYAILRNAVIRVKNVPVFYLPILYYPIQSDDRATGFLMPSYGNSTYRGHSISNAFFWAINRSQDLTLFHDWMFTKGQGYGSEYRYTMGAGAEGQIRVYRLAENAGTLETAGGTVAQDARRSLELRGNLTQPLPGSFRAYGRLDYFSNVGTKQLYQQDFYTASNSTRTLSVGVSGALKTLSLSATATRSERFYNQTTSYVNGTMPSISASLSSRQFGDLPLFGSVQSEVSNTLYQIESRGQYHRQRAVAHGGVAVTARAGCEAALSHRQRLVVLALHAFHRAPRRTRAGAHRPRPQILRHGRRRRGTRVQPRVRAESRVRAPDQARLRTVCRHPPHHRHSRARRHSDHRGKRLRLRRERHDQLRVQQSHHHALASARGRGRRVRSAVGAPRAGFRRPAAKLLHECRGQPVRSVIRVELSLAVRRINIRHGT